MINSLWIAKTGMSAQQTQLDVISHNLANVSTTGYKRNNAVFEDLIYQNLRQVGANTTEQNQLPTGLHLGLGVRTVATSRNFMQGSLQESKNNLDVAINGNGFFEVTMPDGTVGYTRDGSFQVDAQGRMVTSSGLPVVNGITIPANATSVTISAEGAVAVTVPGNTQPQTVGNLAMASFINPAGLEPIGQNLFKESAASGQPQQGTPGTRPGHHQARVSGSLQRQRGGRAGHHDPDPTRLRDEFQGHPDLGPDAGQAVTIVIRFDTKTAQRKPHAHSSTALYPPRPGSGSGSGQHYVRTGPGQLCLLRVAYRDRPQGFGRGDGGQEQETAPRNPLLAL